MSTDPTITLTLNLTAHDLKCLKLKIFQQNIQELDNNLKAHFDCDFNLDFKISPKSKIDSTLNYNCKFDRNDLTCMRYQIYVLKIDELLTKLNYNTECENETHTCQSNLDLNLPPTCNCQSLLNLSIFDIDIVINNFNILSQAFKNFQMEEISNRIDKFIGLDSCQNLMTRTTNSEELNSIEKSIDFENSIENSIKLKSPKHKLKSKFNNNSNVNQPLTNNNLNLNLPAATAKFLEHKKELRLKKKSVSARSERSTLDQSKEKVRIKQSSKKNIDKRRKFSRRHVRNDIYDNDKIEKYEDDQKSEQVLHLNFQNPKIKQNKKPTGQNYTFNEKGLTNYPFQSYPRSKLACIIDPPTIPSATSTSDCSEDELTKNLFSFESDTDPLVRESPPSPLGLGPTPRPLANSKPSSEFHEANSEIKKKIMDSSEASICLDFSLEAARKLGTFSNKSTSSDDLDVGGMSVNEYFDCFDDDSLPM